MAKFKDLPQPGSQRLLWPRSLEEAVADTPFVRVLSEVMDGLDWSELEATYSEIGCRAYPPRIMTKVLVYAYLKGIRSSREIAEMVRHDDRMQYLTGGLRPDFHTIARFRKEKREPLSKLFEQSIRLCAEQGLVRLAEVAVDGTKVRANASRHSLYDEKRVERARRKVARILADAEAVDAEEDALYGDASGEVEAEWERAREKLDEVEEHLHESGRKQVSASDPDCRLMKTTSGLQPSYNVQAAVDAAGQVIVAVEVTQAEADYGSLVGLVEQVEENTGARPDVVLADSGFGDGKTLQALAARGQEALIPPKPQWREARRQDRFAGRHFRYDAERDVYVCPLGRELEHQRDVEWSGRRYGVYRCRECKGCGCREECVGNKRGKGRTLWRHTAQAERDRMVERLATAAGRDRYALRQRTVEPVFGQMKSNRRFDRLLLRGLAGAKAEVALICLGHNLMKCVRHHFAAFCALLPSLRALWRMITARVESRRAVSHPDHPCSTLSPNLSLCLS